MIIGLIITPLDAPRSLQLLRDADAPSRRSTRHNASDHSEHPHTLEHPPTPESFYPSSESYTQAQALNDSSNSEPLTRNPVALQPPRPGCGDLEMLDVELADVACAQAVQPGLRSGFA